MISTTQTNRRLTTYMMTRRSFLAAAAAPLLAQAKRRPNVLFIAADDLNTALGCYGHPVVKTPNVDRLSERGVRFDRAYCQFPLCGPTRASLLTGMRPDTTKVLGNNVDFRDFHPDAVTLPQLFKNNGWFSAREGKMYHMNVPKEVGSPKYQDAASWNHSVSPEGLEKDTPGEGRKLNPPGVSFGMNWISAATAKGQSDDNAANHALALLEQHKNAPFFLGRRLPPPPSSLCRALPVLRSLSARFDPRAAKSRRTTWTTFPPPPKLSARTLWNNMQMDEPRIKEALRGYYASTSFMDDQVGRVIGGLDRMGLADNTIVVFWGDHGWHLGEHTRWQKMSLMEESARVPLIIAAPGERATARPRVRWWSSWTSIRRSPNCAESSRPPISKARVWFRLLDTPSRPWKKAAFTQLLYENITGRSVRTDRYRYIRWEGPGAGEELYDHDNDPREFTNLALKPEAHRVLIEHRKILDAGWRAARA